MHMHTHTHAHGRTQTHKRAHTNTYTYACRMQIKLIIDIHNFTHIGLHTKIFVTGVDFLGNIRQRRWINRYLIFYVGSLQTMTSKAWRYEAYGNAAAGQEIYSVRTVERANCSGQLKSLVGCSRSTFSRLKFCTKQLQSSTVDIDHLGSIANGDVGRYVSKDDIWPSSRRISRDNIKACDSFFSA